MVSSKETTPAGYLDSLPAERRAVIAAVRTMIKKHLPKGYEEAMNWGMLCYQVPLATYPVTYNKQPLSYVALAAQKNNYALYLTGVSEGTPARARLQAAYTAKGKRMDMGGGCLRFKSLEELPMEVLSDIVASTSVDALIARMEASRDRKPVSRATIKKIVDDRAATKAAKPAAKAAAKTVAKSPAKTTGAKKTAAHKSSAAKSATAKTAKAKTATVKTATAKEAKVKTATAKDAKAKTPNAKRSVSKRSASRHAPASQKKR